MEIPLRTAYGQNGRCGMQPRAKHSLRAQAHQSESRTKTVKTETLEKKLRAEKERERRTREVREQATATAGSDVVQCGRPIFDDFFQHLWPYIGNNTANVVFQMVKRLWPIRIDQ
ncbi:hypothetical protein TNCV_4459881 [Trichonephila clavipes]|nr:hypothetical protein TNCV_4459881 [Trichonephila clavipes]